MTINDDHARNQRSVFTNCLQQTPASTRLRILSIGQKEGRRHKLPLPAVSSFKCFHIPPLAVHCRLALALVILLLAEVKHLESLLGSLDSAQGHGSKGRAWGDTGLVSTPQVIMSNLDQTSGNNTHPCD